MIDDYKINNFPENASQILKINKIKIMKTIKQLLKDKLISIVKIGNKKIYSHTSKVKRDMLDEGLHYKYGSKPLHTYS